MSDDDILGLSEITPTPDEPEQPNESHPIRLSKGVGTFLLSAGFTIVVGLILGALQIAGVTSMGLAHLLIALAWVIAVFAVWLWLLSRPRKHTMKTVLLTACVFAIAFFGADRFMVWKKAEQERAAAQQPPPSFIAPPMTTPKLEPSPSPQASPTPQADVSPTPATPSPSPSPSARKSSSNQSKGAEVQRRRQRLLRVLGYPTP